MTGYLEALRYDGQEVNPLFSFLGARLERAEDGEAEIRMPLSDGIIQGAGVVAGGILATLADEAMAHAVLSLLPAGRMAVTAEMNIRYLRSARPGDGGDLVARAKVVKPGRNLIVAEASVFGIEEKLLATAGGTFWALPETK
ncbi:PaaI family thioesterase [Desulfovibrio sp. OttesenSCG-928-I05]|nr:PaaI family thioesterase [Desulfovibrio sp. OttesenSCG-928-I05]